MGVVGCKRLGMTRPIPPVEPVTSAVLSLRLLFLRMNYDDQTQPMMRLARSTAACFGSLASR